MDVQWVIKAMMYRVSFLTFCGLVQRSFVSFVVSVFGFWLLNQEPVLCVEFEEACQFILCVESEEA
jgi:hypothetical protein